MNKRICHFFLATFSALALVLSFVTESHAQFDNMGLNTTWAKGSIVLEDNSTLEGLIQFNDKLGMIKFKKRPEAMEESFVETSVLAMQLYDEDAAGWRNFAVFNITEEETGRQAALLFEVLMEFRDFALLARVERVNVAARRYMQRLGDVQIERVARVGYEQFEILCLVNRDGIANAVLKVGDFERKTLSTASKPKPLLDKRALEKYLADDWDKFQDIVKAHDLNLRKRDEFIRAFEHYRASQ